MRAEAERYLQNVLQPMYSEDEIFDLFESDDLHREGVPPRGLPRYSSSERKARREKARIIRQGIYDFIAYEDRYLEEYRYFLNEGGQHPDAPGLTEEQRQEIRRNARAYDTNREEQHLFYYIPPTATPEERRRLEGANSEIAILFDVNKEHWEQYYSENIALLKNSGDPAYAQKSDAELRAELENNVKIRRGEIIVQRVREAAAIADRLDAMSDPAMPAEELAANYVQIRMAQNIIHETDNYITHFKDGRNIVKDQDMEYVASVKEKLQSRFAVSAERIAAYGNPISELLDPGALGDIDIAQLSNKYDEQTEGTERQKEFERQLERKHKNWKAYAADGVVHDNLANMILDVDGRLYDLTVDEIEADYQNMVESYGFSLGEGGARITCEYFDQEGNKSIKENAGKEELKSRRPIVLEQGGHVAVLTLRYPTSCELVWDRPERLFNYSLQYQNDKLLKQLEDSDKWYQTRSDIFKEMRSSFEEIVKLTKNGLTGDVLQRKTLTEKYNDLLAKTNAYLEKKQREGVGDGHNSLEQGHIAVARELRKYARQKLTELNTVVRARADLEKYKGMSGAEIHADVIREQKYREEPRRRAALSNWIIGRRESYQSEHLPPIVSKTIQNAGTGMVRNMSIDPRHSSQLMLMSDARTQGYTADFAGGMIAAELIKAERAQRSAQQQVGEGPVERGFAEDAVNQQLLNELGKAAIKEVMGKPAEKLNDTELTRFVATFKAEELAAELPAALELQENVKKKYVRRAVDKTLCDAKENLGKLGPAACNFANKSVAPQMDALRSYLDNGQMTCEIETATKMLTNCVILGMMQFEELSGGSGLAQMLHDTAATEVLQTEVQKTESFKDILKDIAKPGENVTSIEGIAKVLSEKKPLLMARQILDNVAFKETLKNNMGVRKLELGRDSINPDTDHRLKNEAQPYVNKK